MILDRRALIVSTAGLVLSRPAFAQSPRIPFEHANGKIFAPAMVNGQPVQAVLDSGSTVIGLDTAFAQMAGVQATGRRAAVRGVQHVVRGRYGQIGELTVGEAVMRNLPALVVDYGSIASTVGRPVEMALGGSFFRRFVVDLDFADQSLAVHPRDAFTPPPGVPMIPLMVNSGFLTAPILFPGNRRLYAIVDTGSDAPLLVSPDPAQRLGLLKGRASTAPIGGIGGGAVVRIASVERLSVGGAEFTDVPVQVPPRSLGPDANLGLGVLGRFRVWLDFGGRRMWLRPGGETGPFHRDLLGFYGEVERDRINITHVAPGSPAAAAGFKAGEVVTAMNGEPASRANVALRDAPEGTAVTFTLAGGGTRRVTLARYY